MRKAIIDTRQALQDILAGMDDSALMKKYNLSTKGLKSLFSKLAAAGYIGEINQEEFIKDIRSGIGDSALMEKYRLSPVGLERQLRDVQDFDLMPVCQHLRSQSGKLAINLREFVSDIRAGVPEFSLLAKYGLSSACLQRVIQKLLDVGAIVPTDLLKISSSAEDTVRISDQREHVRSYPILSLWVSGASSAEVGGFVRDITQTGIGTIGLQVKEGEEKHLMVSADDFLDIKPFLFKGVCKWSQSEQSNSRVLAGFEISQILEDSQRNLQEIIELTTVQFESEPISSR